MKILKSVLPWLLAAVVVSAGTIHTFANGEVLTAANLNAALQHIHNQMVGGHGARLVDADVSASANITDTKIQRGTNIPRAWAVTETICDGGSCTVAASSSGPTISWSAVGSYTVTLGYTATDTHYFANVASVGDGVQLSQCTCNDLGHTHSTTQFGVRCFDGNSDGGMIPGLKNCAFGFVVYDNN